MSVYNVIWADDQVEIILDKFACRKLADKHIKVIGEAHNGKELESLLEKFAFEVDAVITDGNFNESEGVVRDERVKTGLDYAKSLHTFKNPRHIPYFLYTGRDDETVNEWFEDSPSYKDIFPRHKRWFHKSGKEFDSMLNSIVQAVNEQNSPEFQVRTRYPREIEAAELLPGASKPLIDGLLFEHTSADTTSEETYFNPLRMIFEKIVDDLVGRKIIPKLDSLNSIPKFFAMAEVEGFQMNKPIMHKTLIYSLEYFLKITQDGSHDKSDLPIGVIEYVRERKTSSIFRSALYIIMDVLLWYKELVESNIDTKDLWIGNFEAEGKVSAVFLSGHPAFVLNGKYQIQNNGNLEEGTEIVVKKSVLSKHPSGNITRYVFKSDYFLK